jgi:hypothetical protein
MMRKIFLIVAIIALLTAVSAPAQKIGGIQSKQAQTITIQDDAGEGYMVLDLLTGAYKCRLCEYDYSYSGIGSLKTEGYMTTFSAIGDGYSMTAYISVYEQMGKCFIEVTKVPGTQVTIEPYQESLCDSNLRDSVATCVTVVEPPPLEAPAEIILQNDADGSFLVIFPATGAYKFLHCEDGASMSGVIKVTRAGDWLNFEDLNAAYRVLASVNLSAKTGKAAIEVFVPFGEMPPMQEIISDSNFTDNVPACGAKK